MLDLQSSIYFWLGKWTLLVWVPIVFQSFIDKIRSNFGLLSTSMRLLICRPDSPMDSALLANHIHLDHWPRTFYYHECCFPSYVFYIYSTLCIFLIFKYFVTGLASKLEMCSFVYSQSLFSLDLFAALITLKQRLLCCLPLHVCLCVLY